MNKSVLAIIGTLVLAGCVGQTSGTTGVTGTGLAITSFEPDVASQFDEKPVRILLDVENQGEATVGTETSQVYLNGPIGTGALDWKLASEETQGRIFKRDLNPANPTEERPAGTDSLKWTLTAPSLAAGQTRTDTFTARTYYDYRTEAVGTIPAYSEAESIAAREAKQELAKSSFVVSKGPLTLEIRVIPDPVVVTGDKEVITIDVKVSNSGGGTVYKAGAVTGDTTKAPSLAASDLNQVKMKIDAGSLVLSGACDEEQELIAGKPTSLTCDYDIPKPDTSKSYPIKVTLDYGYYIDASTQVEVVGR